MRIVGQCAFGATVSGAPLLHFLTMRPENAPGARFRATRQGAPTMRARSSRNYAS
jgi:hypothetical protein